MSSKQINAYTAANSIDAVADYFLIDPGGTGVYKKINRNTTLSLTSAPLGTTDTQSPTNKTFDNTNALTIKDGSLTIQNSSSTTKQAIFSAASITAGQTRTFTFPDASGTLATVAGTQTLTNKTLTAPAISGGTIDNTTVTVDSISGHSVATTVTVANLQIANGVLNSANAVTAISIAAGAVQPQALIAGTGTGWSFSSFSPTFTNWTIGTGGSAGTTAKYVQIGKTVFFYINSTLGTSGQSVGGAVKFTLPVTAASGPSVDMPIGWIVGFNTAGSAFASMLLWLDDTTHARLFVQTASGNYTTLGDLSSTVPFSWGAGDFIRISGWYEAA